MQALRPDKSNLKSRYQPILQLSDSRVLGYEALTIGYPWYCAQIKGCKEALMDLNIKCLATAVETYFASPLGANEELLFLNVTLQMMGSYKETIEAIGDRRCLNRIVFEVTETESAHGCCHEAAVKTVDYWRGQGLFGVAIDDVSMGYNRIRFMLDLHPDYVKLDHYLVAASRVSPRAAAIVARLVAMAGDIGSQVIAEGVECSEERDLLQSLGVLYAQGHGLGDYQIPENRSLLRQEA